MRNLLVVIIAMVLTSCGYVGDPLPPALKIPAAVTDLEARQVGADILVSFTIPELTIEGLPLNSLSAVELKVGKSPAIPFNPDPWSAVARSIQTDSKIPGKVATKIDARDFAGQEVIIGVRLLNLKNRASQWSNFKTLKVVPPLEKPSQLRALAGANGVTVEWSSSNPSPERAWKVFRQSDGEKEAVEMATVKESKFLDIGAAFDVTHRYSILATEMEAVSEMSDPVAIQPVDTFPPVAPLGLSALAGPSAAQLSWERNQEPDLAAYWIYRSSANSQFAKIAESSSAANFRDNTVMPGQRYRYAISAVDRKGNESPKSEPVEILIP